MIDIAKLGIAVDTSGPNEAAVALDRMAASAKPAADAIARVQKAASDASGSISKTATGVSGAATAGDAFTASLNRNTAALNSHAAAGQRASNVVALNAYQMRNLGFQLNDVATMLASGSSPFQVLATQSGQVFQALQGPLGVGAAVKELGSKLAGILTPARLALGGVVAIGTTGYLAWSQFNDKLRDVQISLAGIGRASGLSAGALADNAVRMANGLSISENLRGSAALTAVGLRGTTLGPALDTVRPYAKAFGLSRDDATAEIAKGLADPGIGEFSKRLGDLGIETEMQARRLRSLGDIEGEQLVKLRRVNEILSQTVEKTSAFGEAMNKAANIVPDLWARLGKELNRELFPTGQDMLDSRMKEQGRLNSFLGQIFPDWMRDRKGNQIMDAWQKAMEEAAKPLVAQKSVDDSAEARRKKSLNAISQMAALDAQSITARTAAERLAIDQRRLAIEVENKQRDASTLLTEQQRLHTIAIAEATRVLTDSARRVKDEIYVGGARTPAERARRQTETEFRTLREQTNVLPGGIPANDNANPARSTLRGAEGLVVDFRTKLEQLVAAVPGISITSGFRTHEQQADTYRRKPNLAAPPGHSNHEYGLAADLGFASAEAEAEAHRRAGEFGLTFPMLTRAPGRKYEPWHIEPFGARAMRNGAPSAVNVGGPRIPGLDEQERNLNSARDRNFVEQTLFDAKAATEANERTLKANTDTFGKSTAEIARSTEAVRLQNLITAQGIPITKDMTAAIDEQAKRQAAYAASAEKTARQQQKAIETADMIRGTSSDLLSSPLKAIANKQNPGEALRQAGARAGDRLIDYGVNSLVESFLGPMGKPLAGIFGKGKSTDEMNVQATTVNVSGGIAGGLGDLLKGGGGSDSSSFLSRAFYGIFGGGTGGLYKAGAAFNRGRVVPFAAGGIADQPTYFPMAGGQTGVMGEAGPEGILPLHRGTDGKLGVRAANLPTGRSLPAGLERAMKSVAAGAQQRAGGNVTIGGTTITISGNADEKVVAMIDAKLAASQKQTVKQVKEAMPSWQAANQRNVG